MTTTDTPTLTRWADGTPVDLESLYSACIDVKPTNFDFSEGYDFEGDLDEPHSFRYIEAFFCEDCGRPVTNRNTDHGLLVDGEPVTFPLTVWQDDEGFTWLDRSEFDGDKDELTDIGFDHLDELWEWLNDEGPCWGGDSIDECPCAEDPMDAWTNHCEGPMMNYYYELGSLRQADEHEAAKLLIGLPVCLVEIADERDFCLALTGGGMDLSAEICEAYVRLGYLPPSHFTNLDHMAKRFTVDDEIVAEACIRTNQMLLYWAQRRLERGQEYLAYVREEMA